MIIKLNNLEKTFVTYKRGSGFGAALRSLFKREKVIVKAVDGISFEIPEGEICGLLGPNGAGKSTIIKMLCGALFPTGGEINVAGFKPARERVRYVKEIGAVFGQKSQLIWDIPPIDSFAMNKAIYGIENSLFEQRLDELVKLLDVSEIIQKPTRVLSLGERMKCEFIMAMLHNPRIVFLDEPTIGLDVIAKANIRDFIVEMNKKGTTFILTTHDLEDVERLAQRIIIINHGKKVFDGSLETLQSELGRKKIVELKLHKNADLLDIKGAVVLDKKSQLEFTLEVDMDVVGISEFVGELSKQAEFTDISIKELPMDKIITAIYAKSHS
ncbi:MAG: ATP-binding cassette domain-containing protein [Oscillospiraceae bacterium]|nr:ATP-binding cassette domain-containing protein [Oscillospiraceae bacterium]